MSFTVDTSIARVTPGSAPTATGTTASFTPNVGDLLVVCACWDNAPGTAATISDSQSGTWTTIRSDSATDSPLTTNNITTIAYRLVASSTSMTVTAASTGAFFQSFKVYRISAGGALSVGATGHAGSSSSNVTPTAYTSTAANSLMVVSAMTLLSSAASTSSDLTADTAFNGGLDDLAPLSGYKTLGAAGSQTFNISATGGNSWHWAAIEVIEASSGRPRPLIDSGALDISAQRLYRQPLKPIILASRSFASTDAIVSSTFGIATTATVTSNFTAAATVAATFGISADASLLVATTADSALSAAFGLEATATVQQNVAGQFDSVRVLIEFVPGSAVYADVSRYVKLPISIHHGRNTEFDEIAPATCTLALENFDGRFTPGSGRSPYFPNVTKDRTLYVEVTKHGIAYPRFVGKIQAWEAEFPDGSTNHALTVVKASDALAKLGQRKMRSNFTETIIWRARADGVGCDAWEPVGQASGRGVTLTNYSTDAAASVGSSTYVTSMPTLSVSSDNDSSFGDIVVSSQGTDHCTTTMGLQANMLQIIIHLKGQTTICPAGINYIATFKNGAGTNVANLTLEPNGAFSGLFLRNGDGTVNLGIIANMPWGQWGRLEIFSRVDNAARSDWTLWTPDVVGSVNANVNLDIRTFRNIVFPGAFGTRGATTLGGVAAMATRTPINLEESWASSTAGAGVGGRLSQLQAAIQPLGITTGTVGSNFAVSALTGRWSGRSALDVAREMLRTVNGIVWARPGDGTPLFISDDQLYPALPILVVDVDGDLIGPPKMIESSDTRPTRIDVEWPGGSAVAVDRAAELAGEIRSNRITSVAASDTAAKAIGTVALARTNSGGTRVASVTLDLTNAANDAIAATLFEYASTKGGLYPSQRIRLMLYPDLFGFSSLDQFVEGWTEMYDTNNRASIRLDLSAAPLSPPGPITRVGTEGMSSALLTEHRRRFATKPTVLIERSPA